MVGGSALVLVVVLVAAIANLSGGSGHSSSTQAGPATLQVSTVPWQLQTPLSRTVAFPLDGRIGIFGGLGAANATTPAITELDPSSGKAKSAGTLAMPVHDAAGAIIGNSEYIFGGGTQQVTAAVQAFDADQPGAASSQATTVSFPAYSPR